ncbi:MAG: c-type cytochrome biogenesis protein CcmI [Paracoccaceae bacterium]
MAEQSATFWMIAGLIGALSAFALAMALWRGRASGAALSAQAADVGVYRDQLAEVERDLARGVLDEDEAARVRLEISRRLLEADRAAEARLRQEPLPRLIGWGVGGLVLLGAVLLYLQLGAPRYGDLPLGKRLAQAETLRENRPSQAQAEARLPLPKAAQESPENLELMEKLRAALKERPGDLVGHELLARNEASLGNYSAAAQAQNQVLLIKGTGAEGQDFADLAELMILAAGGFVSPEAERALGEALRRDPQNGAARYYVGLMFAQNDRADRAFEFWRPLAETGPEDAPFTQAARNNIAEAAALAGIPYDPPQTAGSALGGPSSQDIEAAAALSADERQEMIRGMVDGLQERLASTGGSAEEWARLITSLAALGEMERAGLIAKEAQERFAGRAQDTAIIRTAINRAGIGQ